MSSFNVHVDDPAYPAGTKLIIAGVRHDFVNGESVEVDDSMVDPDMVNNLEETLTNAAGFTVSPVGGSSPSPAVPAAQANPPQAEASVNPNDEGGEN